MNQDVFLSKCLDYPVYDYEMFKPTQTSGRCMYQAKTGDIKEVKKLFDRGFDLIATEVKLVFQNSVCKNISNNNDSYLEVDNILRIASTSFKHDRFHKDLNIEEYRADGIKEQWAYNCLFEKRADNCFTTFLDNGDLAGFLFSIKKYDGMVTEAVIDLMAVDKKYRRKLHGKILLRRFMEHYSGSILRVGTQIDNIASLNLYFSQGFKVENIQYILHKHIGV